MKLNWNKLKALVLTTVLNRAPPPPTEDKPLQQTDTFISASCADTLRLTPNTESDVRKGDHFIDPCYIVVKVINVLDGRVHFKAVDVDPSTEVKSLNAAIFSSLFKPHPQIKS